MRSIARAMLIGLLALLLGGCTLYGWGNNGFGQLGDGSTRYQVTPTAAARNPDWSVVDAGFYHSCGIDLRGTLSCWGNNTRGESGFGTSGYSSGKDVPTRVGSELGWTAISAGGASSGQGFTCGIRDGGLYCWGFNGNGQLGLGDKVDRPSPTRVGHASDWRTISSGAFNSCATSTTGRLSCWGPNGAGSVGDGTRIDRLSPVPVGSATDWSSVSTGGGTSCGIRSGALWCWGSNTLGSVGDGTFDDRLAPVPVGASSDWRQVAVGNAHTCGIDGGTLRCWGSNSQGELGRGFVSDPEDPGLPDPVAVGAATSWTAVAAGESDSCAIQAHDLLWCWGFEPLGDGSNSPSASPVRAQLRGWYAISLGGYHKLALRRTG